MSSREVHKSKDEEKTDYIYDIKKNNSNKALNLYYNNINENDTSDITKTINPEDKRTLSKGTTAKEIKFICHQSKKGPVFFIRKKRIIQRGRKRINTFNFRIPKHCAKKCDNILRKIKSWVISGIIKFINKKLEEVNKNSKKNKLKLYTISKEQSYNTKIDYNKKLLGIKIGDILSDKVSMKTKIKDLEHNENIIKQIKEEKYDNIIEILNLTFLECFNHYFGKERIDCLEGFEEEFKTKKGSISEYEEEFFKVVNDIEAYLSDKSFRIGMNKTQEIAKSI